VDYRCAVYSSCHKLEAPLAPLRAVAGLLAEKHTTSQHFC
jgi:hypothetical protein